MGGIVFSTVVRGRGLLSRRAEVVYLVTRPRVNVTWWKPGRVGFRMTVLTSWAAIWVLRDGLGDTDAKLGKG